MISLVQLLREVQGNPKAIIMAGGAGSGKTYLLNQLGLDSLLNLNPDKYVEDPDHPYYNKLGPASSQTAKDAMAATEDKISFVWDTTASGKGFQKNLDTILSKGYDVYMVMVYAHPMISYISNFMGRDRNIPASAVFSTWRDVYSKIEDYNRKLKGNLSVFVSDRGGKYKKEIEGFDTAAKNGAAGISDYLERYNKENDTGKSTFRQPYEMSKQEEQEFYNAVKNVDYDTSDYSEDRALKKYFTDWYRIKGEGPGDDKMNKKVASHRKTTQNNAEEAKQVLDDIADDLYDPTFQAKLKHSTPQEIDQKIKQFLS
jgi:hypothetical protein